MLDIDQIKIIAQLVDNIEFLLNDLEKAYSNDNFEKFNRKKEEILDLQKKISELLR